MAETTENPNFRHIVRLGNTDLNGMKPVVYALRKIKGVGTNFGCAICTVLHIDQQRRLGDLTEEETKRVEEVMLNPAKFGLPIWIMNRRKDMDSGADKHMVGNDLIFNQEMDVKMMKKMRTYRGVRHMLGLPVRGQRTRSNFRKNKGKVLGVKRTKTGKKQ
jgi:small subunit ribosomal protein S13